jgi:hypothetical protein
MRIIQCFWITARDWSVVPRCRWWIKKENEIFQGLSITFSSNCGAWLCSKEWAGFDPKSVFFGEQRNMSKLAVCGGYVVSVASVQPVVYYSVTDAESPWKVTGLSSITFCRNGWWCGLATKIPWYDFPARLYHVGFSDAFKVNIINAIPRFQANLWVIENWTIQMRSRRGHLNYVIFHT